MSWNHLSALGLLAVGAALIYAAGEAQGRPLVMVFAVSAVLPVSAATVLWGRDDRPHGVGRGVLPIKPGKRHGPTTGKR